MSIGELFRKALEGLNKKSPNQPPILIGGVALVLHGSDRLTKDIDVAFQDAWEVLTTMYNLNFKAVSALERDKDGRMTKVTLFPDKTDAFEQTFNRKTLTFIHEETKAQFDVWLVAPVPYLQLLDHSVAGDFEGQKVRVASLEDLLELKRIALKANPDRTADLADISFLEKKLKVEIKPEP